MTECPTSPAPDQPDYLECEKSWVFALLMGVGGFFGAFTYVLRGGVFCNAQTGNLVLLAIALGDGNWTRVLYLILPITAYFLGGVVSEAIAGPIKKLHLIRWDTLFVLIEMAAVIVLALLPETFPYQVTQIAVNFICSMQYNTFRQAQGVPMATTFCTNHLRQLAIWATKYAKHHRPPEKLRFLSHLLMLAVFVAGGFVSTLLCRLLGSKALLFALIPLGIVLADFLHADLDTEKDALDRVPHGH